MAGDSGDIGSSYLEALVAEGATTAQPPIDVAEIRAVGCAALDKAEDSSLEPAERATALKVACKEALKLTRLAGAALKARDVRSS